MCAAGDHMVEFGDLTRGEYDVHGAVLCFWHLQCSLVLLDVSL